MALVLNGSGTIQSDDITLSGNANVTGTMTSTGALSVNGVTGLADGDMPGGAILQVVQANWSGFTSTTATTWTATGLTTSITPSSTSSKILVFCHFSGCINVDDQTGYYTIFRNG